MLGYDQNNYEIIFNLSFYCLAFAFVFFGLDDLFIDVYSFLRHVSPRELNQGEMEAISQRTESKIAIVIPAWDEGSIIERMICGNISSMKYSNYHFFVGCYPNDEPTLMAIQRASARFPNVHAVLNFKNGPTSKGQILNWVFDSVLDWEMKSGEKFDAFLMHDSEDVIHPFSLKLINDGLSRYDYIQIPVFSLSATRSSLVAGTYIDEFAESHTKDMLVRSRLGGGVPSAGVGTAMSRKLVLSLKTQRGGSVLSNDSLTEDYELGVSVSRSGWRQGFLCCYFLTDDFSREFIATREYFPKAFLRSVRQKTRWTTGIALQGWKNLGWSGNAIQRFFLYRDRKGLIANQVLMLGYAWGIVFSVGIAFSVIRINQVFAPGLGYSLGIGTTLLAFNRIVQRTISVGRVYGFREIRGVVIRWPIANIVNSFASLHAFVRYFHATIRGVELRWGKTSHELPEQFGEIPSADVGGTDFANSILVGARKSTPSNFDKVENSTFVRQNT